MSLDPALSDQAIAKSQAHYQATREYLQKVLAGLDHQGIEGLVTALEEHGLNASVKRLQERPAEFGFVQAPTPSEVTTVELGLKAFLEARDNLDLAVAKSPSRFLNGQLLAFDGKLGRVQPDGGVVMLEQAEPERNMQAENSQDEQDGEDRDQEM
jgi:hypothetical protein